MIKPKRLKKGDKIAIVSLSWGGLGDDKFIHKYKIAKERLEKDFELNVVCMPHALKGIDFIYQHPELRAKDLMDAFKDKSIAAIVCAIGGNDTIRTLPFIDFNVISNNPKIFMGYSDSTINHFMMFKAGLISFYGPSIMSEFGEYVEMFDYTKNAVKDMLFGDWNRYTLKPSLYWTDDYIPWQEENINVSHNIKKDQHGYEIINGNGVVAGHLIGGCIDTFLMTIGTKLWPTLDKWSNAILFIETSNEKPSPSLIKYMLRNLAAQGILNVINGIIVGKPQGEKYYDDYKDVIIEVLINEEKLREMPIIYNVNFGHSKPIGIIPYGILAELNCHEKTITFLESPTDI